MELSLTTLLRCGKHCDWYSWISYPIYAVLEGERFKFINLVYSVDDVKLSRQILYCLIDLLSGPPSETALKDVEIERDPLLFSKFAFSLIVIQ